MDVSIIIVNYNTKELAKQCIESVCEKTQDVSFEIILVDNASTDGSKEFFEKDNRIKYIYSKENLGFGRANNLGCNYSCGKYIFFLNSDTLLLNNAVGQFFDFYEKYNMHLKIGALGSFLLDKDRKIIHSFGPFPTIKREIFNDWCGVIMILFGRKLKRFDNFYKIDKKREYTAVDYVTGADLFVSRDVIEKYGAFDPDFFMYFEETEMQYRWHMSGLQTYVIKDPQIIHLVGASQKKTAKKRFVIMRSKLLYCKKTYTKLQYIIFRILFLIRRIPSIMSRKFTLMERKEYIQILFS